MRPASVVTKGGQFVWYLDEFVSSGGVTEARTVLKEPFLGVFGHFFIRTAHDRYRKWCKSEFFYKLSKHGLEGISI